MDNAPLNIKQSDLEEIAAQLRIHGSSSVKISIFEEFNRGRALAGIKKQSSLQAIQACEN